MSSNISFEHLVCNINDRVDIIIQLYDLLKPLQKDKIFQASLAGIYMGHITENYKSFLRVVDDLKLDMISLVSEYYSIMDEYTDQFHPKYLSIYTAHRNHYNTFFHQYKSSDASKSIDKFNPKELIDIFNQHCYEFKKFKMHTDMGHLRRSRIQSRRIYDQLSSLIASKSIYEMSDILVRDITSIINKFRNNPDYSWLEPGVALLNKFANMKLELNVKEEVFDYCECGNVMEVLPTSSEMVCDHCGFITKLIGTVFEDNQFYNQEGGRYKHAGYEPSKHCKCWLERIQAKETNTITKAQIEKLEACIKRDRITNKRKITISQLRSYLKDSGLTELNEHVALIKKIITGITPPQLTFSETQDITNSFSKAVKAYNLVRPSHKSNNIYYPYILRKLIELHVADYNKQKELLSFIHLQGTQTLIQNDQIWKDICKNIPSFKYQPTDRYAYAD
jgi:hypothetical protein